MATTHASRRFVELTGIALVLYMVWVLIVTPLQSWMLWFGIAFTCVLSASAVALIALQRYAKWEATGDGAWMPHVRRGWPPFVAGLSFVIISVLAADLESGRGVSMIYWRLGVGMVLVVTLFLLSYDRRRRET